jgi:hypothetical protein
VVAIAGALIATGVATAASPLTPIGAARLAEPSPGIQISSGILAAGFAVLVILPLAVLVPVAWRAAARAQVPQGVAEPASRARASRLCSALSLAGSVTGGIGVRMALEPGHGRSAVPVRSALIGTTVAITSVVAAVVFGASLVGLVSTPHRYGQNWAQVLDFGFGGVTGSLSAKVLSREPAISGYATGNYGQLSIGPNRTIVPAIGIGPRARTGLPHPAGRPGPVQPGRDRPRRPDAAHRARHGGPADKGCRQPGGSTA